MYTKCIFGKSSIFQHNAFYYYTSFPFYLVLQCWRCIPCCWKCWKFSKGKAKCCLICLKEEYQREKQYGEGPLIHFSCSSKITTIKFINGSFSLREVLMIKFRLLFVQREFSNATFLFERKRLAIVNNSQTKYLLFYFAHSTISFEDCRWGLSAIGAYLISVSRTPKPSFIKNKKM